MCVMKVVCIIAFSVMVSFVSLASARVDISPKILQHALSWSGDDLVFMQSYCIQSTQEASPGGTTIVPYQMTPQGAFFLDGGTYQIPFMAAWKDLASGEEDLLMPESPSDPMTGALEGCPGGDNARLTLAFESGDITSVPPGRYTADLRLLVENAGSGRNSFMGVVKLSFDLLDSIRVSQLNDIDLGLYQYDGIDLAAIEPICVYRASGGGYGVSVTGSGPDDGGFHLAHGVSQIPFTVSWDDGRGAVPLSPGVWLSNRANAVSEDSTCSAGLNNNAALEISVSAADIEANATTSGPHAGVITIMVEME